MHKQVFLFFFVHLFTSTYIVWVISPPCPPPPWASLSIPFLKLTVWLIWVILTLIIWGKIAASSPTLEAEYKLKIDLGVLQRENFPNFLPYYLHSYPAWRLVILFPRWSLYPLGYCWFFTLMWVLYLPVSFCFFLNQLHKSPHSMVLFPSGKKVQILRSIFSLSLSLPWTLSLSLSPIWNQALQRIILHLFFTCLFFHNPEQSGFYFLLYFKLLTRMTSTDFQDVKSTENIYILFYLSWFQFYIIKITLRVLKISHLFFWFSSYLFMNFCLSLSLVLGFEHRASCLLGRHCTTWATLPGHFCFSNFLDKVPCFCPGLVSDHDSPTYSLLQHWDCNMYHHVKLICCGYRK
jgi:hypothetical protein